MVASEFMPRKMFSIFSASSARHDPGLRFESQRLIVFRLKQGGFSMKALIAVDLSEASRGMLRQARNYAKLLSAKAWLVHVAPPDPEFVGYEPGPQYIRDTVAKQFHEEHKALHQEAEVFKAAGLDATPLLVQGPTIQMLLDESDKLGVDVIMIGSHGHGVLHQMLMGSVCEGVLHKSTRPVLVIPIPRKPAASDHPDQIPQSIPS